MFLERGVGGLKCLGYFLWLGEKERGGGLIHVETGGRGDTLREFCRLIVLLLLV